MTNLALKMKMLLCPVIILAIATIPALLIEATPWPIPIQVRHKALWRPWRDAEIADRIYVVRVADIRGVIKRTATLEVTEVVKGGPLLDKVEQPLGRIAGSDDLGNVYLVFDHGGWWPFAAYKIRGPERVAGVPAPGIDAPGIARFSGVELVEVVKDIVRVQSAEAALGQEHLQILEKYVSGDKTYWYWLLECDVKEFLGERSDVPGASELLKKYRAASEY